MADDREEIALSVLRRIADESGVCGNCGTKCEKVTDGCCDRPWWKPLCPASEASAALAILARQGPGPGEAVAGFDAELAAEIIATIEANPSGRFSARQKIEFVQEAIAATPTRESGNQGSSRGCGTGHSGEQREPAVGATAALAPEWRRYDGKGRPVPNGTPIEIMQKNGEVRRGTHWSEATWEVGGRFSSEDVQFWRPLAHPQKGGEG